MPDVDSIVKYVSGLSVTGVLCLLIIGLVKGWFVTGREHGVTTTLLNGLQTQVAAMQTELGRLRDRDTDQQTEINDLRLELATEKALKQAALTRVDALTAENETLKRRVGELERRVGGEGLIKA